MGAGESGPTVVEESNGSIDFLTGSRVDAVALLASDDFGQYHFTLQYLRETLSSCQAQPNIFHLQSLGETEHHDALEELASRLLLVASEHDKVLIEPEQNSGLVNLTLAQ